MKKEGKWQEILRLMKQNKSPALAGKFALAGKLAAGAASITILSVGGQAVWNGFKDGNVFRPELFANSQALHGNQISFPDQDEFKGQNQNSDSGENEQLQKDSRAEDTVGKENQDRATFEQDAENPNTFSEDTQNVIIAQQPERVAQEPFSDKFSENTVLLSPGDGTEQDVLHTGGQNTTGINAGTIPGNMISSGDSGSGTGSDGNSGSAGSSGGSGTAGGGSQTSGTAEPAPPQPDPAPTPSEPVTPPAPDPVPSEPIHDPDYPDESKQPTLPSNPYNPGVTDDVKKFPSSGMDTENPNQMVKLHIDNLWEMDSDYLYEGAVLTDWKLLCSIFAYADVYENGKPVERYRITDYSDLFRVGTYPKTAEEDMVVSFYFRPNTESDWQEVKHKFTVKYAKVIVLDEPSEDGKQTELRTEYLEKDEPFYLPYATNALFSAHEDWLVEEDWPSDEGYLLDKIFPGWSDKKDGEVLQSRYYQPEKGGRYILYPQERTDVPDGWVVRRSKTVEEDPLDPYKFLYTQKMSFGGWGFSEDSFEIPEGIQYCDMYSTSINELVIPYSVWNVDASWSPVLSAYFASEQNPYLSSQDGVLYDKAMQSMLAVPFMLEELDVPPTVNTISIPFINSITKILLHTQTPPQMDLSNLGQLVYDADLDDHVHVPVTIQIPDGSYINYQYAWGSTLADKTWVSLDISDGSDEKYSIIEDGLFSADGKILYGVLGGCSGFYQIPDGTEIIAEGAFATNENVDSIFIPDSVKELDARSFAGSSLKQFYFAGQTPPKAAADIFATEDPQLSEYILLADESESEEEPICIWVPDGCKERYMETWGAELTDSIHIFEGFTFEDGTASDGIQYINTDEKGGILLKVPVHETPFSFEEFHPEITWTRIGSKAFVPGSVGEVLDVPESVTQVGQEAFAGCSSLKYILFHAKDSIYIGKNALKTDKYGTTLDYAAFDAMKMVFEDGDSENALWLTHLAPENSGTISQKGDVVSAFAYGDRYETVPAGDGILFYALSDGAGVLEQGSWLMGATSGVSGTLSWPEGYKVHRINHNAMKNCQRSVLSDEEPAEYEIPEEMVDELKWIGNYAFDRTNLAGDLVLTDSLESIGSCAFGSCELLNSVTILSCAENPAKSLSIYSEAFSGSGVKEVVFPENLQSLNVNLFYKCENLETVVLNSVNPPELVPFEIGFEFSFGFEDPEDSGVSFELPDNANKMAYIEAWKYSLGGYSSEQEGEKIEKDLYNKLLKNHGAENRYIDEWKEEDSPIYEADNVTYRKAYKLYCEDSARYILQQMLYDNGKIVCGWLGVSDNVLVEPVEEKPNLEAYQDGSIFDEADGLLPDIKMDPELEQNQNAGQAGNVSPDQTAQKDSMNPENPQDSQNPQDPDQTLDDLENGKKDETEIPDGDASGDSGADSGENAGNDSGETGDSDTGSGENAGSDSGETGDSDTGSEENAGSDSGETGDSDADSGENAGSDSGETGDSDTGSEENAGSDSDETGNSDVGSDENTGSDSSENGANDASSDENAGDDSSETEDTNTDITEEKI